LDTNQKNKPVVMYLRTSSSSNLDGDSEERQKQAILSYAEDNAMQIVTGAYDQAVKGSDMVVDRKGFGDLINYCIENDVDTILCENASRFARDIVVQEMGYRELQKLGISLIPVDAPDYFSSGSPSLDMIRQILGAVSQFEKSNLVSKLRGARERIRSKGRKCEGRKSLVEIYGSKIELVARKLYNNSSMGYGKVSDALSKQGFVQPSTGRPLNKSQVKRLIQEKEIYADR
jgi:DNA invertase Pin-like site-specific DNA recombinase